MIHKKKRKNLYPNSVTTEVTSYGSISVGKKISQNNYSQINPTVVMYCSVSYSYVAMRLLQTTIALGPFVK